MRGVLDPKLRKDLLRKVKAQFRLDLHGEHGPAHWLRVRENGLRLCAQIPMADKVVVELFAILHDSQRENEGHDPRHGHRAAAYALRLPELAFLSADQRMALFMSCKAHSDGKIVEHELTNLGLATMAVCWDADRLDLARPGVGIIPDTRLLSTDAARSLLAWSVARSRRPHTIIHKNSILRHTELPAKTYTLPDPSGVFKGHTLTITGPGTLLITKKETLR